MTIALVISDVDGTLVRKDKSLADATVAAVGRLTLAGIPFTLISARPPSGIAPLVARLGIAAPTAAFNGGTIVGPDGEILERHVVDETVVRGIFHLAEGSGATPWVFANGRWHVTDPNNAHIGHERIAADQEPVVVEDMAPLFGAVDKLTWVDDDSVRLAALEARCKEAYGPLATIARSQTYYLDVTHPNANKGDGVEALARMVGVRLEDVAVLGDMPNDLPMFARAGLAVAMGQAPAEVRAAARHVSTSNDEDGVAHAIDDYLLPLIGGKA